MSEILLNPSTSPMASPLQTSLYDRVQSALIAGIAVLTLLVGSLFCLWLFSSDLPDSGVAVPPETGRAQPWAEPDNALAVADFPIDLTEQRKFEDVINSIPAITEELSNIQSGGFTGEDPFNRTVIRGVPFPEDFPPKPVPEYRRWHVKYEADSIQQYTQQLDFFKIELGAVSTTTNEIIRISRLSGDDIKTAVSNRAEEKQSMYFAHQKRKLKRWDQAIIRRAQVKGQYELVHFFSDMVTAKMRQAELNYLNDQSRELSDVVRTQFILVETVSGWDILVDKMEFRESEEGQ